MSFSQLDVTEDFGYKVSLAEHDWVQTRPLNSIIGEPQSQGLPPLGASEDEVYRAAERLSRARESIRIPDDGVYCPICHIATVTPALLRTPCPKCGRPLLTFGWD